MALFINDRFNVVTVGGAIVQTLAGVEFKLALDGGGVSGQVVRGIVTPVNADLTDHLGPRAQRVLNLEPTHRTAIGKASRR